MGRDEITGWASYQSSANLLHQRLIIIAPSETRVTKSRHSLCFTMTTRSSTPSEGEIIESDSEKATKSLQPVHGTSVDPQSRKRISVSRSPSPIRSPIPRKSRTRSRSRSPYRETRGAKRPREDDHYNPHDRNDPRRFKVHYENRRYDDSTKPRGSSYNDRDRGGGPGPALRYDERGLNCRSREGRPRTLSRSPPRSSGRKPERDQSGFGRGQNKPQGSKIRGGGEYRESRGRHSREQSVSDRGHTPVASAFKMREAETSNNQKQHSDSFKEDTSRTGDK